MTKFPRPRAGQYDPYFQVYLDKVPADVTDIMKHLKRQGLVMMNLLKKLDDERAERRYAPDKWSVKEVIGHLIDTERLFAFRCLWVARGESKPQPGMDERLWGRNSNAHLRPLTDLWREQHVCRTDHVYLFRSLDAEGIARSGECNGARLTAGAVPWIVAGHERHHLEILLDRYGLEL
ncbi:MAG: DinB family protein [Candidatus Krumholzibacteriia bacterium]